MRVPSERIFTAGATFASYRILEVLGRGGMGVVYKAQDGTGRLVALKVVSQALATDETFRKRFRREGRAAGSLSHPNVTALVDVGEHEGTPFLAFELLEGGSLKQKLARGKRLPWSEAARLGAGIARGLEAVHGAGMVHRDLKPDNVLLDEEGTPKLADFGLVGAQGSQLAVSAALTKTGQIMGTLEFMAPEQADGKGSVGPRADLYALGALLYALLAGKPPFEGEGYALLKKHLDEAPRPLRETVKEVPSSFERLVLALLEKDPDDRPATAGEVAEELEAISRGEFGGEPRRKTKRKGKGALVAFVALAVVVGGGGAVLAIAWPRGEEPAPPPSSPPPPATVVNAKKPPLPGKNASEEARRLVESAKRRIDEKGDMEKATFEASRAIELDPKLALAYSARAQARARRGEHALARADYDEALELDPKAALIWALRADTRLALSDREGAIADDTKAIETDPRLVVAWLCRGDRRYEKGDLDGAIEDFTRAIEIDPRSRNAYANRAGAWRDKRDLERALADYTSAIECDPARAISYMNRSGVRSDMKDLDGAIEDATRAIELDPRVVGGWVNRAAAREAKGDKPGAISDYSSAIALEPKDARFWCYRGFARFGTDREGSFEDCSRALELDPRLALAWRTRGALRGLKGDLAGARDDLTHAVELDPGQAESWLNRALARKGLGDPEGAVSDLERFLALDPGHKLAPDARKMIEEVKAGR